MSWFLLTCLLLLISISMGQQNQINVMDISISTSVSVGSKIQVLISATTNNNQGSYYNHTSGPGVSVGNACNVTVPVSTINETLPVSQWNGFNLGNDYAVATTSPMSTFNTGFSIVTIYVDSMVGDDELYVGSPSFPLKTIPVAQKKLQDVLSSSIDTSLVVSLNGEFYLTDTWNITELDSPINNNENNYVVYTSTNPLNPATISGGEILSSTWTVYNSGLNIWSAYVGNEFWTLYTIINSGSPIRIERASAPDSPFPQAPRTGGTTWDCSSCPLPPNVGVYPAEVRMISNFQYGICQCTIDSSTQLITMDYNCAEYLQNVASPLTLFYIQNGLPFLTQPNTWVWYNDYLYYIPVSTLVNPNTDVQFVIPRLQTLIEMNGATNVAFNNLIFSDTDWSRVYTTAGIFSQGGDWYLTQDFINLVEEGSPSLQYSFNNMSANGQQFLIPASINVINSNNTLFMKSTIRNMGLSGIRYDILSTNNLFWDNHLYNLSGSAIQIGTLFTYINTVSDIVVQDCVVHDIGKDLYGSTAISGFFAVNAVLDRNLFFNLPYSAINFGQSFGNTPNFQNLIVTRNHMYNFMTLLIDGGGIYTNAVNEMTVSLNFCHDVIFTYNLTLFGYAAAFCFYLDTGSTHSLISANNIYFNTPDGCCWSNGVSNYVDNSGTLTTIGQGGSFEIQPFNVTNVGVVEMNAGARLIPPANVMLAFGGIFLNTMHNCTPSYNVYRIYSNAQQSVALYLCYRYIALSSSLTTPLYQFGGMYSSTTANAFNNNTLACASGFTSTQLLQAHSPYYDNLYYCWRLWNSQVDSSTTNQFGGTFSIGTLLWTSTYSTTLLNNLLTGQQSCLSPTFSNQTFSIGFQIPFVLCIPFSLNPVVVVSVSSSSSSGMMSSSSLLPSSSLSSSSIAIPFYSSILPNSLFGVSLVQLSSSATTPAIQVFTGTSNVDIPFHSLTRTLDLSVLPGGGPYPVTFWYNQLNQGYGTGFTCPNTTQVMLYTSGMGSKSVPYVKSINGASCNLTSFGFSVFTNTSFFDFVSTGYGSSSNILFGGYDNQDLFEDSSVGIAVFMPNTNTLYNVITSSTQPVIFNNHFRDSILNLYINQSYLYQINNHFRDSILNLYINQSYLYQTGSQTFPMTYVNGGPSAYIYSTVNIYSIFTTCVNASLTQFVVGQESNPANLMSAVNVNNYFFPSS